MSSYAFDFWTKTRILMAIMSYFPFESVMVDVAQLVEHQIVALVVVGSIPTIHPIFNQTAKRLFD